MLSTNQRASPDYKNVAFPGAEKMVEPYKEFRAQLPAQCRLHGLNWRDLEFNDYSNLVVGWLKNNPS
jgi:hypothetical protein